jgi:glutaredoxin
VIARGAFALFFALAGPVCAQQYRWVDEQGRTQYSDTPPPASAKNLQKKDLKGGEAQAPQAPSELARLQKEFPVKLYTSPVCKEPCASARELLNQRGVPFKEIQVWDNATNDELLKLSGASRVPVLVVGRSVQSGYGRNEYNELLDSAGYPAPGTFPALSQSAPALPEGYSVPGDASRAAAQPVAPAAPQTLGPYSPNFGPGEPEKPGAYLPRFTPDPPQKPGPYTPRAPQ